MGDGGERTAGERFVQSVDGTSVNAHPSAVDSDSDSIDSDSDSIDIDIDSIDIDSDSIDSDSAGRAFAVVVRSVEPARHFGALHAIGR